MQSRKVYYGIGEKRKIVKTSIKLSPNIKNNCNCIVRLFTHADIRVPASLDKIKSIAYSHGSVRSFGCKQIMGYLICRNYELEREYKILNIITNLSKSIANLDMNDIGNYDEICLHENEDELFQIWISKVTPYNDRYRIDAFNIESHKYGFMGSSDPILPSRLVLCICNYEELICIIDNLKSIL